MKFAYFLFPFIYFINALAFPNRSVRLQPLKTFEMIDNYPSYEKIKTKTQSIIKLIRPENIFPTIFLGATSGFIVNPSIKTLLNNKAFLVSNVITLLVMSNSMIVNDIFDIGVDIKNNIDRPLVNGEIRAGTAVTISTLLFTVSEYLNYKFIAGDMRIITHIANFVGLIYTPLLKKIPFIKNLSCAGLVSFCIVFSGLNAMPDSLINKNAIILSIAHQLVFFGSLGTELLLDICDMDGDRQNKIYTIPVLFGKKFALNFANNIAVFNILWNVLNVTYISNFKSGVFFMMLISPMIYNLKKIKQFNYSKEVIKYTAKETIYPMVYSMIYLCYLAAK
jgi:4-hydroxybenzoate polyprenyltransferase